ncbi:MAG TPA: hypothetical protein VEU11_12090 [Terriglobales bacterium]|nr:hypothetical protein [Terriglobales bacterium]
MKLACCLAFVLIVPVFAQTDRVLGAVTNVDLGGRRITLMTDTGTELVVTAQPSASFRRVAPRETDLQKAATITLNDISVGDRVLARGSAGANGNAVAATLVVVMSQGDIAQQQAADRADWDRRGVVGLVTMAGADQVVINVRTSGSVTSVAITLASNANVRRYAPDSVRFVDARPSTLGEIKTGDQVRARGNRTGDGSRMIAEEVVSGSFRTIAGVILSLNPQQNELRINDLDTKKALVVKVSGDSSLRKLQPQVAQAIAQRVHGSTEGTGKGRGASAQGGGPRGDDLQQMLESSPSIALTDLKAGDAIVISSTVGSIADRVTAITLMTGVEPILRRPGTQEMSLGSWTLDIGNP